MSPIAASHGLRNPLHAISATVQFLREDESLSLGAKEDVQSLQLACDCMQRLVNDVLDLSKLRAGKLDLRKSKVRGTRCAGPAGAEAGCSSAVTRRRAPPPSPAQVSLRDIVDSLREEYTPMVEKGVAFFTRVADNVPEAVVCDGVRLRQVAANGLSNALKYTTSGEVGLQVRV